jgi:hypothetical protein
MCCTAATSKPGKANNRPSGTGQQGVVALLGHPAGAQDHDEVGVSDRAEAVADQDAGPPGPVRAQPLVQLVLGGPVQPRRRLVEDEQVPGVAQERQAAGRRSLPTTATTNTTSRTARLPTSR